MPMKDLKNVRSLVTGGAGAIGSRLVPRLRERGHEVVVVDDLSSGYRGNLPPDVEFHEGSIVDRQLVGRLADEVGFDYVFHLAALFANQNSVDNPMKDLDINGAGTLNLLVCLAGSPHFERLKRLVYTSSSCVYGRAVGIVREDAPYSTDTPYAVTKLMGEYYARYFNKQYAMPVTIVRPFNSFGPGERPGRYRNVIPNFIRLAMLGQPLVITGSGEETRDFTFVDDIAEGFYRAAISDRAIGEAYNLGTGRETKIGDLAQRIVALTGSQSEIQHVSRRSWDHVDRRCADASKAKAELGFAANTTIDEGLAATISWIKSLRDLG